MLSFARLLAAECAAVVGAGVYCYSAPDTFPALTAWFAIHLNGVVDYSCTIGGVRSPFGDGLCSPVMHAIASPRDLVILMAAVAAAWAVRTRARTRRLAYDD